MERLTKRDIDGCLIHPWSFNRISGSYDIWDEDLLAKQIDRLAAYEDTGLEPEEIKEHEAAYIEIMTRTYGPLHQKIGQWLQAEQAGLLVVLPCKVGATVYGHSKAEVFEYKVAVISLATYNWYLRCQNHNSDFWVTDADIGKTVFLTREEAEAALAGKGDAHEADSV